MDSKALQNSWFDNHEPPLITFKPDLLQLKVLSVVGTSSVVALLTYRCVTPVARTLSAAL
jgi:hypothetical protein